MKRITLTQGKFTLVDDADYDWLMQWSWFAQKGRSTYYAVRTTSHVDGKQYSVAMHRELLGLRMGDGIFSDHCDGNGLNNRRFNLRTCSNSENRRNSLIQSNNTSGYKGDVAEMKGPLTPARLKVLTAFRCFGKEYLPTIAEIAFACHISRTTALEHIELLVRDGHLTKLDRHIRKYAIREQP